MSKNRTVDPEVIDLDELPGHYVRRMQQIAVAIFLEETESLGVTPVQFGAMQTVANQPGIDQRTLARSIGLDTSTIASVLDRLEARGLLVRSLSAQDRRLRCLTLSREGVSLLAAVVLPLLSDKSERHQTWTVVVAFALCAVSVVVLTGWGGQLSLGQMAFAGLGALTAAALIRGISVNIGWHDTRLINGSLGGISFLWALLIGASFASLVAVLVGVGALRVRGLLLAISTLAFAIAAQVYLFNRPFFTAGFS